MAKKQLKKKPDYLILGLTLFLVLGAFLFLRTALEEPVQTLSSSEIIAASQDVDIVYFSYELLGGENYDLVQVSGVLSSSSLAKYNDICQFTGIMRIDDADNVLKSVDISGGQTSIIPKSEVSSSSPLSPVTVVVASVPASTAAPLFLSRSSFLMALIFRVAMYLSCCRNFRSSCSICSPSFFLPVSV